MSIKENMLNDYGAVLDRKYGMPGSSEYKEFIERAESFFTGQIIRDTRKEANMTQGELAKKLHVSKSYISRIENGVITPSVTAFYRIIEALGMRVEIVKPLI